MNGPDDWVSEAQALSDIFEGEDDYMDDEGPFFGLPARPSLYRRDIVLENAKVNVLASYDKAKAAKTGTVCACPSCGKSFTKKSYQQAFCSNKGRNNCKDKFWNRMSQARTERAIAFTNRNK